MAKVKQCDRCKKIFEPYDIDREIEYSLDINDIDGEFLDLCKPCQDEVNKLVTDFMQPDLSVVEPPEL